MRGNKGKFLQFMVTALQFGGVSAQGQLCLAAFCDIFNGIKIIPFAGYLHRLYITGEHQRFTGF